MDSKRSRLEADPPLKAAAMPGFKTANALVLPAVLATLFAGMSAPAQDAPAPAGAPGLPEIPAPISLNGTWEFALARTPKEAVRWERFYESGSGVSGAEAPSYGPIPVPANWALHGFEEPAYLQPSDAEGFYRLRFAVPPLPPPTGRAETGAFAAGPGDGPPPPSAGWRTLLQFDGVWASAEVWLNGKPLGRHDSGFTPFAFDVSPHLMAGAENLLAVRVRQNVRDAVFDMNDDWALGGIYRDVRIEFTPPDLWIERVESVADFDEAFRDALLTVRVFVGSPGEGDRSCGVRAVLSGPDDRVAGRAEDAGPLSKWGGRDFFLRIPVAAALPWTAESPNLYTLRVELLVDGRVRHAAIDRVGFREISTAGGVLRVNGHPVRLRGVCRHDQHPDVGRATRREHWNEDLRLMKAANVNAVRTAHYPPAEGFVRLCDELGIYVIEEIPTGKLNARASDPAYAPGALLRAHATVARDRNRPSVILWSIGNEDPLASLHVDLARAVKGMDSTRPVLLPWQAGEELPPEIDVLAPHYGSEQAYAELAARAKRPIVSTEYTHSLGPEDAGGLEARWRALTAHPAGAGAMVWLWADQGLVRSVRGRPVHDPFDFARYAITGSDLVRHRDFGDGRILDAHGIYGADGVVDADRAPQRDYWEVRAVYAPIAVPVESVPWREGQVSVAIPVRNDHDFSDLGDIAIRWRIMDDDRERAVGSTRAVVPPRETTMIELPVLSLPPPDPAQARYVQLRFLRADGTEIVTRSVRLDIGPELALQASSGPPRPSAKEGEARPSGSPPGAGLIRDGDKLRVRAAGIEYVFSDAAGRLASIDTREGSLASGMRPVAWRSLTLSEAALYWRGHKQAPVPADLDRYQTEVRSCSAREEEDVVRVEAKTGHRVDALNGFETRADFRIGGDGILHAEFEIRPRTEAGWVPEAGMELETAPELGRLRWLGLGPLDAYPNKKAAAIFGVWEDPFGTKAVSRWAELTDGKGRGLRVEGVPYVRFEPGKDGQPGRLRILSHVAGRNAKFDRPDRPEHRLDVGPGASFKGAFTLRAISR